MDSQFEPYDYLLVATGSKVHYFDNDSWEKAAPGLKTIEDALEMRARILSAFERAETEHDPIRRQALMTFVVVGGRHSMSPTSQPSHLADEMLRPSE